MYCKFKENRASILEVTNMTLLVYLFILHNTIGTGSWSPLRLSYKNLALVSSFQSTNFHSNRIIGCKDLAVQAISGIMRIFPKPEVLSQKFEKLFLLFNSNTSCTNFSSVALIVTSES